MFLPLNTVPGKVKLRAAESKIQEKWSGTKFAFEAHKSAHGEDPISLCHTGSTLSYHNRINYTCECSLLVLWREVRLFVSKTVSSPLNSPKIPFFTRAYSLFRDLVNSQQN